MNKNFVFHLRSALHLRLKRALHLLTAIAMMTSALVPGGIARAELLTPLSLTLGNAKPATATNARVSFRTATLISGDATASDDDGKILVRFPVAGGGDPFTLSGSLVAGDITLVSGFPAGVTVNSLTLSSGGGSAANDTITIGLNQTDGTPEALNIAAGSTLVFDILNNRITTPAKVAAAGTADVWQMSFATRDNAASVDLDTGSSQVSTLDETTASATINTTLSFTLSAIAGSTSVFGITTDRASTAVTIPFGTLAPNSEYEVAHRLSIVTNAPNGYNVYLLQNGNLTSGSDDVDVFQDGSRIDDSANTAWTSPAVVTGNEATYGHVGYGSTDADVFATNNQWAGIPSIGASGAAPVTTGLACNGAAATTGDTCDIVYKIEVSALQEAGTYTNELYYVIVPLY